MVHDAIAIWESEWALRWAADRIGVARRKTRRGEVWALPVVGRARDREPERIVEERRARRRERRAVRYGRAHVIRL
jgi:hypothetical protein